MNKQQEFELQKSKISNEELIELAHKEISELAKSYGKSHKMSIPPRITDTDMLLTEVVKRFEVAQSQTEALKKEIEELKEKTEWISVKERLPKEFTSVLVIGNDIRSCALYRDKKFYTDFPLPTNEEITHWMPLPTPPKQ